MSYVQGVWREGWREDEGVVYMYSSGGCLTTTVKCAAQMACHSAPLSCLSQRSSVMLVAKSLPLPIYLLATRVGSLPIPHVIQFTWGLRIIVTAITRVHKNGRLEARGCIRMGGYWLEHLATHSYALLLYRTT